MNSPTRSRSRSDPIAASRAGLEDAGLEGDYLRGVDVVRDVLAEPLFWVATNAGYDAPFSGAVALSLVNRDVPCLDDTIAKWLPRLREIEEDAVCVALG